MKGNIVSWFEIPVKKLGRAMKFYSTILSIHLEEVPGMPRKMAFFPFGPGIASGGLVEDPDNGPSLGGTLIYLAAEDVAAPLGRVVAAGGKILLPKTSIGEHGFIAQFQDTEGNRVALHSTK